MIGMPPSVTLGGFAGDALVGTVGVAVGGNRVYDAELMAILLDDRSSGVSAAVP